MSLLRRAVCWTLVTTLTSGMALLTFTAPTAAAVLPPGFQEQIVFAGLDEPTNIEFAPDGRVFVTEKRGIVKIFESLSNPAPVVFADLTTVVNSQWDRGLLGLALSPNFATDPWVYVLYTYDAPPGQTAPYWNDACPAPTGGSCLATARVSRLRADGNHMTGAEQVLLHDWCQQFPSHSIGDLQFGQDGALYVSGGDGASFNATDYGQLGTPINPCGDPPGDAMTPPTAEGGSLRSQDVRTTSDPTGFNGALLRVDPETGEAMPGNPLMASPDLNARRMVAHGFRNPFRFAVRPGTSEVWVGDVGSFGYEEINRVVNPPSDVLNFGWPCFEGPPRKDAFDNRDFDLCETLYTAGGVTAPYYNYVHGTPVSPGSACPTSGGSITGLAFYPGSGGPYPPDFRGALFFADYTYNCIWAMKAPAPGALPSPDAVETLMSNAANPVDLAMGPGGELYYVDLQGGSIRRVRYFAGNQPPTAVISTSAAGGPTPLTVEFDATGSSDPDPSDLGRLTYEWDLDGDGSVDSTSPTASFTYADTGTFVVTLTVTDTLEGSGTANVTITPGNDAPTAVIDTPVVATTWRVDDEISFAGHGTDLQDGTLPDSAFSWHLRMRHCATLTSCHLHILQEWTGVSSGSFAAPDHEYPSYLELELSATDSSGLSHNVVRRLDPKTVNLTFASSPPGLSLSVGDLSGPAPFTRTVIQGSTITVGAVTPQIVGGERYEFTSWSDGEESAHALVAPTTATTYTATYDGTPVTNVALNKSATGSAPCVSAEGPAKAFNGSWTGGNSDKWCSKTSPRQLQVDLGTTTDIAGFVVHHAGAGGENVGWNTKDFNIQVSSDGTSWTTVATTTNNNESVTLHPATATGRHVRLNIVTPTNNGTSGARIYEFEVLAAGASPPPPPPPPPPPTATNLALNRPATGSTPCASTEGPAKAFNGSWTGGNPDKWCSKTPPRWLQVDLGTTANITGFVVHHAGAGGEDIAWNTKAFNIQVSSNGTSWTTVATTTNNNESVTLHPVTTTGRYVRLNIVTPTNVGLAATRIYEFEVLGAGAPPPAATNLALNRPATGSTPCANTEGPAKAFNGSWTGGNPDKWCSKTPPRWLQVDLGTTANITGFVVHHAGAGGENIGWNTKDFNIQVSSNGTSWTTVATTTNNNESVTTHPATATGRYVRLNIVTPTNVGLAATRIYEFEVMGTTP